MSLLTCLLLATSALPHPPQLCNLISESRSMTCFPKSHTTCQCECPLLLRCDIEEASVECWEEMLGNEINSDTYEVGSHGSGFPVTVSGCFPCLWQGPLPGALSVLLSAPVIVVRVRLSRHGHDAGLGHSPGAPRTRLILGRWPAFPLHGVLPVVVTLAAPRHFSQYPELEAQISTDQRLLLLVARSDFSVCPV